MRKVKLRNVKELYDDSGQVLDPKIALALKDSSKIQGPAGETDQTDCIALLTCCADYDDASHFSTALYLPSYDHVALKEDMLRERHFQSSEIDMKEQLRNCNVCAIPCSCCMHSKQMTSPMGINTDEFSDAWVDESDVVKDPPESRPVDHNKVSDSAEIEVRICDICGDAGREDLLAICSTGSDGAEHIYCMREKLNKIPEGDWMCEECILNEENKRDVLQKFEKAAARVSSQPSLNTAAQNFRNSSALDDNNSLKLNSRGKVKSSPNFSSKRPSGQFRSYLSD
ncbi:hypothetical protein Patl1_11504 [Pistacia atlantica]|uniref:Uncharacterized protein n=1 Tax=Pistacia atlantica TaxID=434234 RepID=A0ACC1A668_9ROSI|nr:hypothetical protein Patl1_11504 [Pistacia atlantica]